MIQEYSDTAPYTLIVDEHGIHLACESGDGMVRNSPVATNRPSLVERHVDGDHVSVCRYCVDESEWLRTVAEQRGWRVE